MTRSCRRRCAAPAAFWEVPTAPGFGVEIDEKAAAQHPFKPEVMATRTAVLDDGTVVDW